MKHGSRQPGQARGAHPGSAQAIEFFAENGRCRQSVQPGDRNLPERASVLTTNELDMQDERPYTRRRHVFATFLFLALHLMLGTAWRAWESDGADWLPGWGQLVPGVIAGIIFYFVLRPSSKSLR